MAHSTSLTTANQLLNSLERADFERLAKKLNVTREELVDFESTIKNAKKGLKKVEEELNIDVAAIRETYENIREGERMAEMAWKLMLAVVPVGVVMAVVGVAANIAAGGWNWTTKAFRSAGMLV